MRPPQDAADDPLHAEPLHAEPLHTIVIGAGQAGLAMSRVLQRLNAPHAVLERGRVGETWSTQRWDSFRLNTPNAINLLPDEVYAGHEPGAFATATSLVERFRAYARKHELPIEEGVAVTAVRSVEHGFEVVAAGSVRRCRNLVLCSGNQNQPRLPQLSTELPADVVQLHAADYRRADRLPQGAVVVVGSGQTGAQIAEDLLESGRRVYLATSSVTRFPRRYRGKDILEWLQLSGLSEQRPADLADPNEVHAPQGQVSGTRGGHTLSLQQLARDGATLLGRVRGVRGHTLDIGDELLANTAKADAFSTTLRSKLDALIDARGLDVPAPAADPADEPYDGLAAMAEVRELDLQQADVRSVVWATGFGPRFDYLDASLVDERGRPRHTDGVCDTPGLYCLGLLWLRRRFSGLVAGVAADAEFIGTHIAGRG